MEQSQTTKQITEALISFHLKVEKIKKDANNPFFKSKYASLSNILDAITIPLSESNLTFVQFPEGENGLTSMLMHSSGEWIKSTYEMRPVKDDPQGRGSCITYQRRYALSAILGLNIADDDDGNEASAVGKQEPYSDDREWLNENSENYTRVVEALKSGKYSLIDVKKKYKVSKALQTKLQSI